MEVHPPHEPIHSWRDFFIHIATITIGLLIAIGLEQTVEYLHHRHMVERARTDIRHEIEINQAETREDGQHIQDDINNIKANLAKLKALRADRNAMQHGKINSNFSWSGLNNSAWSSARDSGALTYMPPEEVQRFADLYNQQRIVEDAAVSIFTDQVQTLAPFFVEDDPAQLSPEDIHTMSVDTARIYARLVTLQQILDQLGKQYSDILTK